LSSRHDPPDSLERLVKQLLLDRTDGLPDHALAAFIDGWGSLLRVLERGELVFPDASGADGARRVEFDDAWPPQAAREALAEAVRRIRAAQDLVLGDDPMDVEGL
jgi:hypothetical protein